MTSQPAPQQEHCLYCEAKPERLKLAEALDSGHYQQLPRPDRHSGLLRDPQGRYSITGVAAAEITPTVWVRATDMWAAYPLDVIVDTFPDLPLNVPDFPSPDEQFLDKLTRLAGPGTVTGCPEETACALGLHEQDESTHPDPIEIHAHLLSPDERREAGIPADWTQPYPLDLLDFKDAARFLRRFDHFLIGHCTADEEDTFP